MSKHAPGRRPSLNRWTVLLVLLAAVGLIWAVSGCSTAPAHGTVDAREFRPAHYTYYTTTDCVLYATHVHTSTRTRTVNGRSQTSSYTYTSHDCGAWQHTTHPVWHAPSWWLHLDDGDGHRGWREVGSDSYGTHPVGSRY